MTQFSEKSGWGNWQPKQWNQFTRLDPSPPLGQLISPVPLRMGLVGIREAYFAQGSGLASLIRMERWAQYQNDALKHGRV
jgi:hypothetical protein